MDPVASHPLSPRRFARRYPVTTFMVVLVLTWLLAGFAVASWVNRPDGATTSATIRSADGIDHDAGRSGGHR